MSKPDVLLDSDVLIDILRGMPEAEEWSVANQGWVAGIPVLVRMEVLQGARNRSEQQALIRQLQRYPAVHLKDGDTERALSWFEAFRLSHSLGIIDCLIAAVVVRLNMPLYTLNLKHYQPIPGLDARAPYTK